MIMMSCNMHMGTCNMLHVLTNFFYNNYNQYLVGNLNFSGIRNTNIFCQ